MSVVDLYLDPDINAALQAGSQVTYTIQLSSTLPTGSPTPLGLMTFPVFRYHLETNNKAIPPEIPKLTL